MVATDKYLDQEQKVRMWDNMAKETRIKIWNSTRDEDLVHRYFEGKVEKAKNLVGFSGLLG